MTTALVKVETRMTVEAALEQGQDAYLALLGKVAETASVDKDDLTLCVGLSIKKEPKIRQCTGNSIIAAIRVAVKMNLMPDGQHGALVVFGKNELVFMPMYKGYIKVARESGAVTNIDADIVHEKDRLEYQKSNVKGENYLKHQPSLDDDPGPVVATYAIAHLPGEDVGQFTIRPMRYLRKVEAGAKRRGGAVWSSWPEQQMIKTAIRYLSKLLPQTPELARVIAHDDKYFGAIDIENGDAPQKPVPTKAALTAAMGGEPEESEPLPATESNPPNGETLFPDVPYDGPTESGG